MGVDLEMFSVYDKDKVPSSKCEAYSSLLRENSRGCTLCFSKLKNRPKGQHVQVCGSRV